MVMVKIKKIVTIIFILFILNTLNGCIEEEVDKNSEEPNSNFKIKNLQIFPTITIPRQPITISIDVENLNNTKINDSVTLQWDNGEKLSKKFNLNTFETKTINWEFSEYELGIYNFRIGEFEGSYEISDNIAWFEISNLQIQSDEIEINEITNISVNLENIGYISDYYILELNVDDKLEQTKNVTVGIGEKKNVSFQFKKSDLGRYNIKINDLKGKIQVVNFKQVDFKFPLVDKPSWKVVVSTDYNMFDITWKCDEKIRIVIYEITDDDIELFHSSLHSKNDGSARIIIGEKRETLKAAVYGLIIRDIYDKIIYKTKKEFSSDLINISVVGVSTIYTDIAIEWTGSESSFPVWVCMLKFYIDGELIEEKSDINWVFHNPTDTIYDKRIYHYSQSIKSGFHKVKIILRDCHSNTVFTLSDYINY
jgi:hypothetical protein